jgi:two-component system, cell cycle response regulator DivK
LHSESILVVDDEPSNLRLLTILLSKHGYQVHAVRTAEEALEIAAKIRPRLVLADIQLPGMDGLEMTRALKSNPETKDTVVVAVTAFAMKGDEEKALEAGCDGYITKPIDLGSLPNQKIPRGIGTHLTLKQPEN